MQLGRHYSITIRGETYYAVCVGTDEQACYLKDIDGNLLAVPYADDLAFSTVKETFRHRQELDQICDKEADKEFEQILQEALAARKLVASASPLEFRNRSADIERSLLHLQNLNASLVKVEELLKNQNMQYVPEGMGESALAYSFGAAK